MESLFPTLKRGANQLCASGAFVRTLLMQSSIAPRLREDSKLASWQVGGDIAGGRFISPWAGDASGRLIQGYRPERRRTCLNRRTHFSVFVPEPQRPED